MKTTAPQKTPASIAQFGREIIEALEVFREIAENNSTTEAAAFQTAKSLVMQKMKAYAKNEEEGRYNEMLVFAQKSGFKSVSDAIGAMSRLEFELAFRKFKTELDNQKSKS